MRDVSHAQRPRKGAPRSASSSAALPHGAPPETAQLTAELREAARLLRKEHPDAARRLRARAKKLESGASLEDLAAAGDGGATLVLEYAAAHHAAPLLMTHEVGSA